MATRSSTQSSAGLAVRERPMRPRKRGEQDATPRAGLAAVTRSLNSLIDNELSAASPRPAGGRQVALATGLKSERGASFPVLLVVSQKSGHTDHAGRRARLGSRTDVTTSFQILDPANRSTLASGSFGNGSGSRKHRISTAARTLSGWLDGKLAELEDQRD